MGGHFPSGQSWMDTLLDPVATSELEMSLDGIPVHGEVTSKRPDRRPFFMEHPHLPKIIFGEFRVWSASHVDRLRNRLDVIWIDAQLHTTQMIGLQPFGELSDPFFPHGAMGDHSALANGRPSLSVSLFSDSGALPNPTGRRVPHVLDIEESFINQTDSSTGGCTLSHATSRSEVCGGRRVKARRPHLTLVTS